jgi:hypothetical protein
VKQFVNVSLMTKPCFLLLPKRIMYDSWSMFTIQTVSLMTKPCFLLLSKRIMYSKHTPTVIHNPLRRKHKALSLVK